MKRQLWLLLIPLIVFAGQKFVPVNSWLPVTGEEPGYSGQIRTDLGPRGAAPLEVIVGRIDTVGGSVYDMEFNGPPQQTIFFDPGYGIHVTFIQSSDFANGTYPDRNMRYNFYDLSLSPPAWAFNQGSDFMLWGLRATTPRSGFGDLDVHPETHCAHISGHYSIGSVLSIHIQQDQVPGSGSFVECADGVNAQLWPATRVSSTGRIHVASMQDPTRTDMFYQMVDPWCTYSTPYPIAPPDTPPRSPTYNLVCSRRSNTVVLAWMSYPPSGSGINRVLYGYYKKSTDNGETWGDAVELPIPEIYNVGDTVTTFMRTSMVPWFDWDDSLHIAAMVMPLFGGMQYVSLVKSSLWDWCSEFGWRLVHAASTDTMEGTGGNRWFPYAHRLVIAQCGPEEYIAVWEQNDSLNIEPNTGMCRADILGSRSTDRGATWSEPVRLRTGGVTSRRYVFLAQTLDGDSCDIIYLDDLEAGCSIPPSADGSPTNNPIIHQRFSKRVFEGLAERKAISLPRFTFAGAAPNPFRDRTRFSFETPRSGKTGLRIYDQSGQLVKTLLDAELPAGRQTITWDGRDDKNNLLPAGIYFGQLTHHGASLTRKVTITQ